MNTEKTLETENRHGEHRLLLFLKRKRIQVVFLVLLIGIGLVNIFVIPPFMNPDEIQHFMFTADYAYDKPQLKKLDENVLKILKEHKWFHFIGVGPGWEEIKKIEHIYFLKYFRREKQTISRTYFHFVYGKILKYSGIEDTLTAFYLLRIISFLIYLVIFLLSFSFYRKHFPGMWVYLIFGQLLIFQLCTILNSINYDVLLTLLGVLFFMHSYRFLVADAKRSIIYLVLLSALAVLIKTAGLLFFVYFFILLLIKYRIKPGFLKKLFFALFSVVIVFSWFNYLFPERFFNLYSIVFSKFRLLTGVSPGSPNTLNFLSSILDSFYFHTGWMGFKLPSGWYVFLKLFLFVSLVGVLMSIFLKREKLVSLFKRGGLSGGTGIVDAPAAAGNGVLRKWMAYTFIIFLIQVFSILFYYGSGIMAQGRYLFPLLIPIVMLVYMGLKSVEDLFGLKKHSIIISFILFQVVFFLFSLFRVVSVFYLEIASPHPGL